MAPTVTTGDILRRYPYLWLWQRDRGETEGRKVRPVCVAVAARDSAGLTHLALLAISGEPPRANQQALELPLLEIRRLDLREWKRAWVYVSEYNYDVLEKSFHIEPEEPPLPRLSPGFTKLLLREFRSTLVVGGARVDRQQS